MITILNEFSSEKKAQFLKSIFINHAERLNDQEQKLSPKNDWIKSSLLY
jgi:hypothetical protein